LEKAVLALQQPRVAGWPPPAPSHPAAPGVAASPDAVTAKEAGPMQLPAVPIWASWRQAPAVVFYPPHLKKTATIAFAVGTILFAINQLDVVVRGDATAVVWVKVAVTYLVPFCVSNAGVLVASRRTSPTEEPSQQEVDDAGSQRPRPGRS
jgi:hypothetical protein